MRRNVAASGDLVEVDEFAIRPLYPTPRGLIDLARKNVHDRDGDIGGDHKGDTKLLPLPEMRLNLLHPKILI